MASTPETAVSTIATNGCFDLLHVGHIRSLQYARSLGDRLIVGLNSDRSVRELKGVGRPIFNQDMRWEMLLALRCVDEVVLVDSTDMVGFLSEVRPDKWVKFGYTMQTLNPMEVDTANMLGIEIVLRDAMPGISTTSILQHLNRLS